LNTLPFAVVGEALTKGANWVRQRLEARQPSAALDLCVELPRSSVTAHSFHQGGDVFQLRRWRQAVAEVEDMAGTTAHFVEHAAGFGADDFGRGLGD
jgi:hypothetical protein